VADPIETVGKISMLNELFPLFWAPRAGFTVQGLVPNLSRKSPYKKGTSGFPLQSLARYRYI
jgi:hypothetical protein